MGKTLTAQCSTAFRHFTGFLLQLAKFMIWGYVRAPDVPMVPCVEHLP